MVGAVRRAAADLFSRPAFYWALAAVFALRVAVLSIINNQRPDAEGMWEGARAYLTNPAHMYDAAAHYLAASHVIAPPGTIYAFVSRPPVALLAIPVALLPKEAGVQVWTAIDTAALLAGLFILYRVARPSLLAAPVFWVVAMYFPPVFADISAGQRGGVALLGAMASIWFESRRPWIAGALGGLAAALKYYPAAMIIVPRPWHMPGLATVLSYASSAGFAGAAVWAAWRSGWNAPYGMALGFSLGALIPNEVWPYQWLPILPLLLLVAVRAIELRRATTLVLIGVLLLGFYRPPCDLPFPNLWTLAAIAIFVLGVWENRLFRALHPLP